MKTHTTIGLGLAGLMMALAAPAQNYNDYFEDRTLRVDYTLSGDAHSQTVSLDELYTLPSWAGRKHRMAELPLLGNGQVVVRAQQSHEVLYTTSFSTLYQEWLGTDEAAQVRRSFEHTVLLPFPKQAVEVELTLLHSDQTVMARYQHVVDPQDILIHALDQHPVTPHRYLHKAGDPADCIDVAILAEGYTAAEMEQFYADAEAAAQSLFSHEPFKQYRQRFNIVAVASPSKDSGVSIPRLGEWKQTAFSSHFSTFYSDRYLTTRRVKALHDALAGIPYEHLIVLANTAEYGGGGIYNSYTLTAAHHPQFRPVVVHEFGHSFAGLADEYYYEDQIMTNLYPLHVEPWEQNITTRVNFASKWQDLLPANLPVPTPVAESATYPVGLYEGAGSAAKGIYRSAHDCRMKTNSYPTFCPVCQRAISRLIQFYTEPAKR